VLFGLGTFPKETFFAPLSVMLTPPGGFITLGLLMAVLNIAIQRSERKNAAKMAASD
jgi:Na+-translocating ferredoxin:NAD+ oxidoreductase RnfE subunit